jgi:hypothetical protein
MSRGQHVLLVGLKVPAVVMCTTSDATVPDIATASVPPVCVYVSANSPPALNARRRVFWVNRRQWVLTSRLSNSGRTLLECYAEQTSIGLARRRLHPRVV